MRESFARRCIRKLRGLLLLVPTTRSMSSYNNLLPCGDVFVSFWYGILWSILGDSLALFGRSARNLTIALLPLREGDCYQFTGIYDLCALLSYLRSRQLIMLPVLPFSSN